MISEYQGKGQVEPLDIWKSDNKWTKLLNRTGNATNRSSETTARSQDQQRTAAKKAEQEVYLPSPEKSVYGKEADRDNTGYDDSWDPNPPQSRRYDDEDDEFTSGYDWDPNLSSSARNNQRYG